MNGEIKKLTEATFLLDDETGVARRFAVNKNLGRADGAGLSDITQTNRYTSYRTCKVDQSGFSHGDRKFASGILA